MITTNKSNFIQICNERGYALESVMDCVTHQDNDMWTIDEHHPKYPKLKIDNNIKVTKTVDIGQGVGSELKKIISWFNIHATPNCTCNQKAKIMNDNGILWCKNNQNIILDWLKEEADKRKLPFIKYIVKKIIKLAIHRAEKASHA
jgi:hypothetical protein